MLDEKWGTNSEACKFFGVTKSTLLRWEEKDRVKTKRTTGNHRRYLLSNSDTKEVRKKYIYVRVSSNKQRDDMERQCSFLLSRYPDHTIVKDVGSGLNYKRRGLLKLLEWSNTGLVSEIVVYSKDRLCRFGFELLEWQFLQNNTKLVVYEQSDKTREQEFTEDILAILQVFACRWNGTRRYRIDKDKEIQIEIKQYTETTA